MATLWSLTVTVLLLTNNRSDLCVLLYKSAPEPVLKIAYPSIKGKPRY